MVLPVLPTFVPVKIIDADSLRSGMNTLGIARRPFLWGISYDMKSGFVIPDALEQKEVLWHLGEYGNDSGEEAESEKISLKIKRELPRAAYSRMFAIIRGGLLRGDSFLANLTGATEVECGGTLRDIFLSSSAPFRLLLDDRFVCFSPEPFVKITGGEISTYPMKGTADATLPDAEKSLLDNYKEKCEHYTIVDLMRNDLSSVAKDVYVKRFRYVERIATSTGGILQTSSEISGTLPDESRGKFGDIILPLLPAGSITGAPKQSTVNLINRAEHIARGWYTGVFGYFDGEQMQTAVMIRCLQRTPDGRLFFHSGGGITVNSNEVEEYAELKEKICLAL